MRCIRGFVFQLLLLLVAAPSMAATYWVSPTGTSGKSGADSLSNATTLAWFNANAVAGDICRFKSGTYTSPIFPTHDGTASARIRYYGFPQDPSAVTVTDIQFGYSKGSYCTARWFRSSGGFTGCTTLYGSFAIRDSIASCWTTAGDGGINICGQGSVFDSLRISGTITGTGQTHWINLYIPNMPAASFSTSNVISNCTFTPVVNTAPPQGDLHIVSMCHTVSNTFFNNTFNITVNNCSGYFYPVELYESYYNSFQKNTWNINMAGPVVGSRGVWCHRDSSSYNRYVANTVNVYGTGGSISFMLTNSGTYPETTHNNYYGNNVIYDASAEPGTGVFWYYNGCRRDTVEYNTISNNAGIPAVLVTSNGVMDGAVFRHNTYHTTGPVAFDCAIATVLNSPRCTSDIFYCGTANASGSENVRVANGFALDSSGVYFSPGGTAAHAIYVGGVDGAPGSGGKYGLSGKAVWGSPQFTDSSYASFNPTLKGTSYAVSSNLFDGFAGAVPFGGGSSDVTPPATVNDLAVSTPGLTTLSVSWIAPGNDGMTGTATAYDLRWSLSAITAANFLSAATPVPIQPVPVAGGVQQSWVATGLSSGTTYYYALRARDAVGNWSGVSNSASGTTTAGDTTAPAVIHDLATGP